MSEPVKFPRYWLDDCLAEFSKAIRLTAATKATLDAISSDIGGQRMNSPMLIPRFEWIDDGKTNGDMNLSDSTGKPILKMELRKNSEALAKSKGETK